MSSYTSRFLNGYPLEKQGAILWAEDKSHRKNVSCPYKVLFFFLIIEKPATTLVHIPAALINPELQSRIRVFSPYKL